MSSASVSTDPTPTTATTTKEKAQANVSVSTPSTSVTSASVNSVAGSKRTRDDMECEGPETTATAADGDEGSAAARKNGTNNGADKDASKDDEWQTVHNGRAAKKLKKLPKKDSGNYPALSFNKKTRLQSKIQVSDLRNLVTYLFADGTAPQWIAVHHRPHFRKAVAILVPGLEEAMFQTGVDYARWMREEDGSTESLQRWLEHTATPSGDAQPRPLDKAALPAAVRPLADVFAQLWPVRARGNEKYATLFSPVATFLTAPLPKAAASEKEKERESQHKGGPRFRGHDHNAHKDVRTRITEFLATPEEYMANDFALHPALLTDAAQRAAFRDEPGWVHTDVASLADGDVPEAEIEAGSVTAGRRVYAVDCEMCKAADDVFVLTRISVVAWDGEVVMDELVRPDVPIVDYLTPYSGITAEMLAPVTTTLRDVQARLLALLDARAILVGHSLDSDVRAMQLTHPFVVDTSIIFPHPMAPAKKHALRWLSAKYLGREIQRGHGTARGHDSVEDARTCLDLVKRKCEKGKAWGGGGAGAQAEWAGGEAAGENLFHRLARAGTAYRSQGGPRATGGIASGKSTAAVDWGDARRSLSGEAGIVLGGCHSDADVEAGIVRAVQGDADGKVVPGGGVDFVWARMRELEALQGWWNRNRLATGGGGGSGSATDGPPSREMLEALMAADEARHPESSDESDSGDSGDRGDKNDKDDKNDGAPFTPGSSLERALRLLAQRLRRIHDALPPCTALMVFSGSGDPRAMSRLQAQRAQHKKEYHTPGVKWDAISVPWTDTEAQLLQQAVRRARDGIAFLTVK